MTIPVRHSELEADKPLQMLAELLVPGTMSFFPFVSCTGSTDSLIDFTCLLSSLHHGPPIYFGHPTDSSKSRIFNAVSSELIVALTVIYEVHIPLILDRYQPVCGPA